MDVQLRETESLTLLSSDTTQSKDPSPAVPPVLGVVLTVVSGGIFLWIWALMWGNWVRRMNPATRVGTLAFANIVPGALFYINLPSLLLAKRENDVTEIARLHIAMVLWGTIAVVSLILTGVSIFVAQRRITRA